LAKEKLGPQIFYDLRVGDLDLLTEARYQAKKLEHGVDAVRDLHVGKANLAEIFQLERLWHIVGCDLVVKFKDESKSRIRK
jgi:hypothetical protein